MDFFQYTEAWYKGEIFEGKCIAAAGVLILLVAAAAWKFGESPNARALIVPLALVGFLLAGAGLGMAFSNKSKLPEARAQFEQAPEAFAQAEQARVESFQFMYQIGKLIVTVCLLFGIIAAWLLPGRYWQAAALALVVVGPAVFVIDYFSIERADEYAARIEEYAGKK